MEQTLFVVLLGAVSLSAWGCNCVSLFKAVDEEDREDKNPSQLWSGDPVIEGSNISVDNEDTARNFKDIDATPATPTKEDTSRPKSILLTYDELDALQAIRLNFQPE